jgi:CDP-paratose 2-epimerase
MTSTLLVSGSSGLVGSECVRHFGALGWRVHGIDNNLRLDFFGSDGDTAPTLQRLLNEVRSFRHHAFDLRDRDKVFALVAETRPDLIVHTAAQPSHDLAATRPLDDFDINAGGTMNLLEAARLHAPAAPFCFLSTDKVYGEAPNELPLRELPTRWEYADPADHEGVTESMRIDRSKHSLFGASKVAADIMVQEYGRYYGMNTACFRAGCLTGHAHAAAEQHGFLGYLVKCCRTGRPYRVFGFKGKQVRDNLHAADVCRLFEVFHQQPRQGEVYNMGGGRPNSCSVLEAIELAQKATGRKLSWTYVDQPRIADHICYISNLAKLRAHFPAWSVTVDLDHIMADLAAG